ncbi:MAG: hypothetical protein J5J00_10940 [Deltaproteobacteria bacterium]|nr:hypothetical protein [Deltaproteobacteria bacterium]
MRRILLALGLTPIIFVTNLSAQTPSPAPSGAAYSSSPAPLVVYSPQYSPTAYFAPTSIPAKQQTPYPTASPASTSVVKTPAAVSTEESAEVCIVPDSSEVVITADQLFSAPPDHLLESYEEFVSTPYAATPMPGCEETPSSFEGNVTCAVPTPEAACRYSTKAKYDECGISGTGNVCRKGAKRTDDLCCDWTVTADGKRNKCECNTKVIPYTDETACVTCMLRAEASTEKDPWCVGMVLCTMKERMDWAGITSYCELNATKTKDAAWFTPDKCTCDRTAPNKEKVRGVYTNQYCECVEEVARGEKPARYDEFKNALEFQCPKERPNFYNGCDFDPCGGKGVEIKPPAGVKCKHKFYRCNGRA